MDNKWSAVAALFDVQMGEEFDIEDTLHSPYKFTDSGLVDRDGDEAPATLSRLVSHPSTVIKRPFRPQEGEEYWFVIAFGECNNVSSSIMHGCVGDYLYISSGNCYRTKEEAQKHVEEWADKAREFFGTVESEAADEALE